MMNISTGSRTADMNYYQQRLDNKTVAESLVSAAVLVFHRLLITIQIDRLYKNLHSEHSYR
jgi:hypothetical protein